MPGLYTPTANILVPDSDLNSLYQDGGNIAFLNNAGTLLSILDNSGNVHFQASPGGATVNAYVTFAAYTNTNVAAYLPTDSTILTLQSSVGGLQTGLNSANANIAVNAASINTINYNIQSIDNDLVEIYAELDVLQNAGLYSNTNVAAYLPADPTILQLQGNISTLTGNTIAQQNAISGLQFGLNTTNITLAQHTAQIGTLQTGLNAANVSIGGLQLGLNSANTSLINIQSGLNSSNITAAGIQTGLNTTNIALGNTIANVATLQSQVYSNTNVASYLTNSPANYNGNVVKANQPFITSLGSLLGLTVNGDVNVTGQTTSGYFVGDGSGLTNLPTQSGTYSNTNVASYLSMFSGTLGQDITISGNLTVLGNSIVTNTEYITGSEVIAGIVIANANVVALNTTSGSLQVKGGAGVTGAVFANNFVGDGSGLTGITATQISGLYGNTEVSAFLPTFTGNIGSGGGYVFGNGYALLGLTFNTTIIGLQNGINHANAEITGLQLGLNTANTNIQSNAIILSETVSNVLTLQSTTSNIQTGLNTANANIVTNANNIGNVQTGLNTANSTIAGVQTGLNTANTTIDGVQTGLNTANTNISGLQTGLNTTNVSLGNVVANVTTLQGQVYTNSNVAQYLTEYTGNITAGNVSVTGNTTATYLYGNGYFLSGIGLDNATEGYYGAFYDTTTQINGGVTLRNLVTINSTSSNKGISVVNNSNVTVQYNGTYTFTARLQYESSNASSDDVQVWWDLNGADLHDTNSVATIDTNTGKVLVTTEIVLPMVAGDYVRLWWWSPDATTSMTAIAAGTSPTRPAVSSIILIANQVTSVQLPNGNIILTGDTTGSGTLGSPFATTLSNTTVVAGTYGGGSGITPVFTVDHKGRITSASNVATPLYSNTNVAAYIPTDSTIIGLQTGLNTANTNISGLQTGLNTTNATIATYGPIVDGIQLGLNSANANITTLQGQVYANSNAVAYFTSYSGSLFHDLTIGGNLVVNGVTSTVNKEIVMTEEIVAGILTANANITSSSTTTGSLIVVGGVGVSGDVYASTLNGDGVGITNLANNTALQNIQTGLNSANTTISSVQTGLNSANTTISSVQTGLNTANTNISNNTANIGGLQIGLNTANTNISTNATNISGVQTGLNSANGRITTLEGQVYSNTNVAAYIPTDSTITGLQTGLNTANSTISGVQTGLNSANTSISTNSTSISNVQTGLNTANGRITTLEGQVYSNTQVAAYLPTYTGNVGTGTGYFYGNGYYLTGITSGGTNYSDSNVAAYLASYPTTNINITGEITATGGPTSSGNINGYYFTGTGLDVVTVYGNLGKSSTFVGDGVNQTVITGNPGNLKITDNSSSITLGGNNMIVLSHGGPFGNVKIGSGSGSGNIMSNGNYPLSLYAGGFTNSGVITLQQGANQNIIITPNGTGTTTITNLTASEKVFALGTTGGTITPTFSNGSVQTITLNSSLTLNGFTGSAGQTLTLIITNSAVGGLTLTSTMKFAGGTKTLSTAANAIDILSIFYDGTTYYASLSTGFA